MFIRFLMLCSVLALAGCDLMVGCDFSTVPHIRVVVQDSITGQPLAGDDVMVIAFDGEYADTATGSPASFVAAFERPGTYLVQVTAPGYETWIRENVRVRRLRSDCEDPTTELIVRMQPVQ